MPSSLRVLRPSKNTLPPPDAEVFLPQSTQSIAKADDSCKHGQAHVAALRQELTWQKLWLRFLVWGMKLWNLQELMCIEGIVWLAEWFLQSISCAPKALQRLARPGNDSSLMVG